MQVVVIQLSCMYCKDWMEVLCEASVFEYTGLCRFKCPHCSEFLYQQLPGKIVEVEKRDTGSR